MTEPLKIVIVGCGSITGEWINAIIHNHDGILVGFVDLIEDAARACAAHYGKFDVAVGTNLDSILTRTTPDVVFNCTVPAAHAPVTLAALQHGCHVMTEKPMTDSLAAAHETIAAARATKRSYAVMQNRRYDTNIHRLRSFIESGKIGPITTINSDFYIGAHFDNFLDHMPHVLLTDMAIHTFDAARFITGADPVSVYCKDWNPAGSWYAHGASAVAVFEMTGGIIFTYRGSWCSQGLPTTWESEWRVIGQEGSLRWDGARSFQAQITTGRSDIYSSLADVEVPEIPALALEGHAGCIAEFLSCVRAGDVAMTNAQDNIKSLAMILAAIESAERGVPVSVTW